MSKSSRFPGAMIARTAVVTMIGIGFTAAATLPASAAESGAHTAYINQFPSKTGCDAAGKIERPRQHANTYSCVPVSGGKWNLYLTWF